MEKNWRKKTNKQKKTIDEIQHKHTHTHIHINSHCIRQKKTKNSTIQAKLPRANRHDGLKHRGAEGALSAMVVGIPSGNVTDVKI